MYCKNCGNPMDERAAVCINCGYAKGTGENFCMSCGQPLNPNAAVCLSCGVAVHKRSGAKSKLIAGLLGVFVGGFGIHNFYLGFTKRGLTQLLVSLIGGLLTCGVASFAMWVWGLVEGIFILIGKQDCDFYGVPLSD